MTLATGEPQPVARSKPVLVEQHEPPKSALVPWVTSVNACGSCWASEVSSGAMKPGRGRPWSWACWFHSAIIPATSGAAALVPPTKAMLWPEPLQPWTELEQTIGYPGAASANAAMSGTMRLPEVANDWAGCHQGRASKALEPPPPPALAVKGVG